MNSNKAITIHPVTRIEGHATITIHLDEDGQVKEARFQITSLKGFEKFIRGRPAEEVPRIVSRICGICPWMHHIAATRAVEACFGVTPPPVAEKLRELCLLLAHVGDKILHFFFLAAPDFILGPDVDYSVRNIATIARDQPELARKVASMRRLAQKMLEDFTGRAIHPVACVIGGFSKPMTLKERDSLLSGARELLDFSLYALDFAQKKVFQAYREELATLGTITTGFLGTVDDKGLLNLYRGNLRLMKSDGTFVDFPPEKYTEYISEKTISWSYGKIPYAKAWNQGFSMDLDNPRGIYRSNTLARINVAESISTPFAQRALEEFLERFGRPAQSTLLYHWARLIELVYTCERAVEILEDPDITNQEVRVKASVGAGTGVGCLEAPRGTLIHHYTTDDRGCITKANMIVGTTHNLAPINMSVAQAAASLIGKNHQEESLVNKVEMAVRAYDP